MSKVDHPAHYNKGGIECIDAMESAFGAEAVITFCKLNAFKYIWRAGNKEGSSKVEDLDKARWYLNRAMEMLTPVAEEEPKREIGIGIKMPSELKDEHTIKDFANFVTLALAHNEDVSDSLLHFLNKHSDIGIAIFLKGGQPHAGVFNIKNTNQYESQ